MRQLLRIRGAATRRAQVVGHDGAAVDGAAVDGAAVDGAAVDGAAVERPAVYVSPFTNTTNRYIELHKELLADLGYEVRPFSLRQLSLGELRKLRSSQRVVSVHWLETRLFRRRGAGVAWSWAGCAEFAAYALLIRALGFRAIYFVHDHAVHDAAPWQRQLSRGAIRMLCALASERVVHDPSFCRTYDAKYLPHPLYWGAKDEQASSLEPRRTPPSSSEQVKFGIFGALRRYKRIGDVLEVWPKEAQLEIRGKGDAEYVAELESLVRRRELVHVTLENEFLTDDQVRELFGSWDVLILPHDAHSMLVSGAFFEAIGKVPALVMRETPFSKWCAEIFGGVFTFRHAEDLPGLLNEVAAYVVDAGPSTENQSEAIRRFGWQACLESYGVLWKNTAKNTGRSAAKNTAKKHCQKHCEERGNES